MTEIIKRNAEDEYYKQKQEDQYEDEEEEDQSEQESDDNDNNNDDDNDDDILDNTYVDEFLATEDGYQDFYQEPVETVELFFLYVNYENVIVSVRRDVLILASVGTVARDQLITCIKRNQTQNEIKYKLKHLIRFNFDLHPLEITDFLKEPNHNPKNGAAKSTDLTTGLRFLTPEKYFDDLTFRPTISIFQDLNALFFVFQEDKTKNEEIQIQTRRQTRKIRPMKQQGLTRRRYKIDNQ